MEDLPKLKIKFSVFSKSTLNLILDHIIESYEVDGWKMTKKVTKDGILVCIYPLPNESWFVEKVKQDVVDIIINSRKRLSANN